MLGTITSSSVTRLPSIRIRTFEPGSAHFSSSARMRGASGFHPTMRMLPADRPASAAPGVSALRHRRLLVQDDAVEVVGDEDHRVALDQHVVVRRVQVDHAVGVLDADRRSDLVGQDQVAEPTPESRASPWK